MNVKALSQPWYKEPWPWILMAGPACVIVAAFFTLWLAASTSDPIVEDDYYKQGLAVNQLIHRDKAAQAMGLKAEVMRSGTEIRVFLTSETQVPLADEINLRLTHPTLGGLDQTVSLKKVGQGFYSGRLNAEVSGRWHVALEDQDLTWRLQGDWRTSADTPLKLLPQH